MTIRRHSRSLRVRYLHRIRLSLVVSLASLMMAASVVAQELPPDESKELADLMTEAKQYEIRTLKPNALVKLHDSSVLNFTNPERNQERGSVLIWMQNDRPAVIGQFFRFGTGSSRSTKHAFHSLVPVPLEATLNGSVTWSPDKPGIEWKSFDEAPDVSPIQTTRLLQMRQLVRPFKVTLYSIDDKPTELRFLPKPLFEYSSPRAGVTGGVIFSYVIATDPEAILLVETFDESGKTGFRYAFARFHFLRLAATNGDKEIWSVPVDREMFGNTIGNPITIKHVYNSYRP